MMTTYHGPAPVSRVASYTHRESITDSVSVRSARRNAREEMNRFAVYLLVLAAAAFAFIALTAVFVSAGAASENHSSAAHAALSAH